MEGEPEVLTAGTLSSSLARRPSEDLIYELPTAFYSFPPPHPDPKVELTEAKKVGGQEMGEPCTQSSLCPCGPGVGSESGSKEAAAGRCRDLGGLTKTRII